MTVLPLYGFVQGDTMGVVVLGRLDGTVAELGSNLLRAVAVRVQSPGALPAADRRRAGSIRTRRCGARR